MTTPRQKAKAATETQSFDLDQARAIRRDREGTSFNFLFGGEEYTCLTIKEWSLAVTELIALGKMNDAMRLILGDDQYDRFEAGGASIGDIEELVEALGKFSGVGDSLGE